MVSLEWCNIDSAPFRCSQTNYHLGSTEFFLLCFSCPWHCPLPFTLPEGEPLILKLRAPVARSPVLISRGQSLIIPEPLFAHCQDRAGFWADMRRKTCSVHPWHFASQVLKPKPYKASHQSVPSASSLHSFFISCKQLSTLFPTNKSLPLPWK